MVNYTCPTCNKQFKKKDHFITHIEKKKKPCQPNAQNPSQNPQFYSQNPHNSSQNIMEIKNDKESNIEKYELNKNTHEDKIDEKPVYLCIHCHLVFNRKDNLKRHTEKFCKVKKLEKEEHDKKIELLLKENDDIKKQLNSLTKEIEKQKERAITQNINKGNIINNNNNIIIPQIKLADFGTEDFDKIDPKKILKVLELSGVHSLIGCLNNIHNNDDLPQYKNVFITDKSRDKALIW